MSKAIKKVGSAVKKFAKSKIGKAILIGATIYLGGAALGAWSSPFSSINGALVKGGAKAAATGAKASAATVNTGAGLTTTALPSTAAGATTASSAGSTLLPGAGVKSIAAGGLQTAAPTAAQSLTSSLVPAQLGGTSAGLATPTALKAGAGVKSVVSGGLQTVAAPTPKPGLISSIMSKTADAGKWVQANPYPSAMLLSGAASAMSPDQIDVMREQERLRNEREDQERLRREGNMDVSNIEIPRYNQAPLRYLSTGQPVFSNGIINRNRA